MWPLEELQLFPFRCWLHFSQLEYSLVIIMWVKKKKKLQPFPDTVRHMTFGWVGNAAFIGVCICTSSENI